MLVAPHITEKASALAGNNTYAFKIHDTATKTDVMRAVKTLYGVMPEKVRIVRMIGKKMTSRGKKGKKPSIKKAYISLPKGSTIDLG